MSPADGGTAVCFSGGGSRAYVAALGQLEGLRSLGLSNRIGHVAGVSGGAWAAAVHCWASSDYRSPALIGPAELSLPVLDELASEAPHGAVSRADLVQRFTRNLARGMPAYEAWRAAVYSTILAPLDIPASMPLSARRAAATPYPHLAASVLGPSEAAPFDTARRSFTGLDFTPRAIRYRGRRRKPDSFPAPSGGRAARTMREDTPTAARLTLADALAISSYFPAPLLSTRPDGGSAGGGERGGLESAGADASSTPRFTAPLAGIALRVRRAVGERWRCVVPAEALGGGTGSALSRAERRGSRFIDGRSIDDAIAEDEILLGDGGACENLPLPLLLANVNHPPIKRCLCIFNVGEELPPTAGAGDAGGGDDALPFCEDLGALFGVTAPDANLNKDLSRAQIFERRAFAPLVQALQRSASRGSGAVATTSLRTVPNDWWGVAGGREITITWMYMTRAPKWEEALPPATRRELPPPRATTINRLGDASRASPLRFVRTLAADAARRRKRLDSFPQYPLTRLQLSAVEANALYQLSGHVVRAHKKELRALFDEDMYEQD